MNSSMMYGGEQRGRDLKEEIEIDCICLTHEKENTNILSEGDQKGNEIWRLEGDGGKREKR